jgi:hypothetical protein
MSLIVKSEIFRANRICENADSATITTISPTFKKKPCMLQKKLSRKRDGGAVLQTSPWTPGTGSAGGHSRLSVYETFARR